MASSSIPSLKASLLASLSARPALASVQVSYGVPLPSVANEFVWIGDVHGTEDWQAMNIKQEEYALDIILNATVEGTDQQAATERAFVFRDEIDTMLLADSTVGGLVSSAKVGGTVDLSELASPDGMRRGANLTIQIVVWNRIQ